MDALTTEVDEAQDLVDRRLAATEDILARMCGPARDGKGTGNSAEPENPEFEYLSLTVPRLVFDNPIADINTNLMQSQGQTAKAIYWHVNRWIEETQYRRPLTLCAFDMCINWGVLLHTLERVTSRGKVEGVGGPGKRGFPLRTRVDRLPPNHAVWDPRAMSAYTKAWEGHRWVRSLSGLIEFAKKNPTAGWNLELLRGLSPSSSLDDLGREKGFEESNITDEVVGYDIWVRDERLKKTDPMWSNFSEDERKGCWGTVYTILCPPQGQRPKRKGKRGEWARAPRPMYGAPDGPYVTFGAYPVQNSSFPLSPLMASKGQNDELGAQARAMSRSARKFKRLILVNDTDSKLADQIASQPDSFVLPVRGLAAGRVAEVALGGLDPGQIQFLEMLRARSDRTLGSSESLRGRAASDTTATAEDIAAGAAADRVGFLRRQYEDAVADSLRRVARNAFYSNRVVHPLPIDAAKDFGMQPITIELPDGNVITIPPDPWFEGGRHDPNSGLTFEDLELTVRAGSMTRSSPAQKARQFADLMGLMSTVAPLIPQMPYVDWDEIMDLAGRATEIHKLRGIIDTKLALQLFGMEQQARMREARASSKGSPANASGVARLGGDVGKPGLGPGALKAGGSRGQGASAGAGGSVRWFGGGGSGGAGRGGERGGSMRGASRAPATKTAPARSRATAGAA